MSRPLLSVMIPTYGQAHYLAETIESVLRQDYPSLEVVVADDCSPDNTRDVVQRFLSDQRVRYVRRERNVGRVANYRNTLYELVRGNYVTNVDGDDLLGDYSYLSKAVELLETDPKASMCFGRVLRFDGPPPSISRPHDATVQVIDGSSHFLHYWKRSYTVHHLGTVYRKREAKDFYRRNIISADIESLLRAMPGHNLYRVDTIAGLWRGHEANASVGMSVSDAIDNLTMVESIYEDEEIRSLVPEKSLRTWRNRMLYARIYGSVTTHFLKRRRIRQALTFLHRAIKRYPSATARVLLDPRLWAHMGIVGAGLRQSR